MKKLFIILLVLFANLLTIPAFATQVRVFVADFDTTGVQKPDEIKKNIQTLLTSRMNGDNIVTVAAPAEADAVISGSYISIGKNFSLDTVAKATTGKILARAFIQGGSDDELIPAIGKLAEKLTDQLSRISFTPPALPIPAVSTAISPKSDIIINDQIKKAAAGDFIKQPVTTAASGWQSQRLEMAANLLAVGKKLADGSREIFLTDGNRLFYYHQGKEMKLIADSEIGTSAKIISLDTVAGSDDNLDIYLTIIRSGELNSEVWQVTGNQLKRVAKNLPYYFRSMSLNGESKKLYAQPMGRSEDYYGDVSEASRNGSVITLKNNIKMPRYGNIYSFNQFREPAGRTLMAVINSDGYLIVYDQSLKELWQSNDRFGGTELYFQREDNDNIRVTGDQFRWIFMNQRIQVSRKGEILVGKNDGFWVLGNARSYKSGAVYCLTWNGSSLEEKWRTRATQNYMPDYYFDETNSELLILQTVQRTGFKSRGASSLSIKKVE